MTPVSRTAKFRLSGMILWERSISMIAMMSGARKKRGMVRISRPYTLVVHPDGRVHAERERPQ